MSIGVAIAGAGSIGAKHAEAAAQAGVRVISVFDTDMSKATALAGSCNAEPIAELSSALRNPAVQAVVICVPNRYHKQLAIDSLQAGKDVLLEKPMAMCARECHEIMDAAAANHRILQMGYVHRYTAVGKLAIQMMRERRLGNIYHITAQVHLRRGVPGLGRWFTTREISGGGSLIDIGVHVLDLGLFLMNYPEVADVHGQVYSVFGRRMNGYVYEHMWAGPPNHEGVCDVEDSAHAFIRLRNGATIDLHVSWAGNFPEKSMPPTFIGCFGERGGMTFQLFGDHVDLTHEQDNKVVDVRIDAPETVPFRDQMLDFAEGVKQRKVLGASGQEGALVQSIVDRIYSSSVPHTLETPG